MFLCFIIIFGIIFVFGLIYWIVENKVTNKNLQEFKDKSKKEWEEKEIKEKKIFESNLNLKKDLDKYKSQIDIAINSINDGVFPNDYNAMVCLINITPKMYVKYYDIVKSHVNCKDMVIAKTFIKNKLIRDFPIIIVDGIIEMFLYIFNTKQNVYLLKEIIHYDKSSKSLLSLSTSQNEIDSCIDEAKRLLRVEENDD